MQNFVLLSLHCNFSNILLYIFIITITSIVGINRANIDRHVTTSINNRMLYDVRISSLCNLKYSSQLVSDAISANYIPMRYAYINCVTVINIFVKILCVRIQKQLNKETNLKTCFLFKNNTTSKF